MIFQRLTKITFLAKPVNVYYIDVLDGLRAISVLFIAWFHFWQQSWLSPSLNLGSYQIDLLFIPRSGYIFVDVLILLSGFCLFLPHARHMLMGADYPSTSGFYLKRALRILPSYWLCLFVVLFFFTLPNNEYNGNNDEMWKDLLSHLSFTQTFWPETYSGTHLNVVLWTLAIEVQFYLIFPLLAKIFTKQPIPVYFLMVMTAQAFRFIIIQPRTDIGLLINQLPNFLDVYANGMLGVLAFIKLAQAYNESNKKSWIAFLGTLLTLISAYIAIFMMQDLSYVPSYEKINAWQSNNRFAWSIVILMFILSSAFSMPWLRWLLSNKLVAFISFISYNFFIWHQYLAVQMKKFHFPASVNENPHIAAEYSWQILYMLIAFSLATIVGTILTYGFEKPVAENLSQWFKAKKI